MPERKLGTLYPQANICGRCGIYWTVIDPGIAWLERFIDSMLQRKAETVQANDELKVSAERQTRGPTVV